MNVLICTQKVDKNDPILGFFHDWVIGFAAKYDYVTVICLFEGEHDLPENVKVFSLGKEKGASKVAYLMRFYKYIWSKQTEYDVVFVHMNQITLYL